MEGLNISLAVLAGALALLTRPWRMLRGESGAALLSPLLATLVVLPWLWAMPSLRALPLHLQWSGASLVLLMLGWPLATLALLAVAALTALLSPLSLTAALSLGVWQGVVPATLAFALGGLLRRWVKPHPFVYVLGRGFLGTVLCLFAASMLSQWLNELPSDTTDSLNAVARWLMAWGDAVVTGMLCAIFVAFRPQWLATWSDRLYLQPHP